MEIRQTSYLDEAEPDVVLPDLLVRLVEEGGRRDAEKVPLLGEPLVTKINIRIDL